MNLRCLLIQLFSFLALWPLKCQAKLQQTILLLFLLLSFEDNKLYASCESSAKQRIHMKNQAFFFFFRKTMKKYSRLSSAAVGIGALRVKCQNLGKLCVCLTDCWWEF